MATQRLNRKYLEGISSYNFDTANAQTVQTGNLGIALDQLALRTRSIVDIYGTEQREFEREAAAQESEETLSLVVVLGILAVVLLLVFV